MGDPLLQLAIILALASGAQVLAAATGLPQIVPLLIAGVVAGPAVLDLFNPDELFGDLLNPLVSLAVGVVLFDGSLQLRHRDLGSGLLRPVMRLVTIGLLVSWILIGVAVHFLLGVTWQMSALCGAILTLSGPTVVVPLLHHIKPAKRIGTVLEWEGILVDPIGAIAAVITFEAVLKGVDKVEGGFLATVFVGAACGIVGTIIALYLLRLKRIPMATRTTATLAIVLLSVAVADHILDDAGLVSAITVGVGIASRERLMSESEQREFGSFLAPLVGLIVGVLFVVLSARVSLDAIWALGLGAVGVLAILIFVQRPLAVGIATFRSVLSGRERGFAAGMMPRGIVVASTASAFQIQLSQAKIQDAEVLVPLCFLVIATTVTIYGLGGRSFAKALGVAGGDDSELGPAGATSAEGARLNAEAAAKGDE